MYRKVQNIPIPAEDFELPFEGELWAENRWVIMSKLIPWSQYESEYAEKFSSEMGAPAKPFRMALAALIIKEKLGISDRETVEQIRENPYLQFFIGQNSYSNKEPFDASMMVHFRQRIGSELIGKLNKKTVKQAEVFKKESTQKKTKKNKIEPNQTHRGKLLIDA